MQTINNVLAAKYYYFKKINYWDMASYYNGNTFLCEQTQLNENFLIDSSMHETG